MVRVLGVWVIHLAGEDLLLDAGRLDLDPVQDGGGEDVQPGVDLVRHELLGLLHEAGDLAGALLVDDHPVLGGLLHLGDHDGALLAVPLVEGHHLPGDSPPHCWRKTGDT